MNTLFDQTDASGAHRLLVTSVLKRAGIVKEISEIPATIKQAGQVKFADSVAGLWPLDSADNVIESATSVELQRTSIAPDRYLRITREINKSAGHFNCLGNVGLARSQAGRELFDATSKQASIDWALPEYCEYPIGDGQSVLTSATQFCENRGNLPYPWRVKVATAILKAASDTNVRIPMGQMSILDASAANGFGLPQPVARQLVRRAEKIAHRNKELAGKLYAQAAALATSNINDIASLKEGMKLACRIMDEIDDIYDLRHSYGRELEFPEDVAFTTTVTKLAAAQEVLLEIGDKVYVKEDVVKILPRFKTAAAAVVGEKLAAEVLVNGIDSAKVAKITAANASVLNRVLHGFGIRPVNPTPKNQASIVNSSEIENWLRVADAYGSDVERDLNGGFKIRFPNPSRMGLGTDQPIN